MKKLEKQKNYKSGLWKGKYVLLITRRRVALIMPNKY